MITLDIVQLAGFMTVALVAGLLAGHALGYARGQEAARRWAELEDSR